MLYQNEALLLIVVMGIISKAMIGRSSSIKGPREDTVRTSMWSYAGPKVHASISGKARLGHSLFPKPNSRGMLGRPVCN